MTGASWLCCPVHPPSPGSEESVLKPQCLGSLPEAFCFRQRHWLWAKGTLLDVNLRRCELSRVEHALAFPSHCWRCELWLQREGAIGEVRLSAPAATPLAPSQHWRPLSSCATLLPPLFSSRGTQEKRKTLRTVSLLYTYLQIFTSHITGGVSVVFQALSIVRGPQNTWYR